MLEAEGVDDRRGHRRAGHLVDGADDHRASRTTPAPRRCRMRHDAGYAAAAIADVRARRWPSSSAPPQVATVGRIDAAPQPGERGRRAGPRSPSTCATPTTPCCARPRRGWPTFCDELAERARASRSTLGRSPASSRSRSTTGVVDAGRGAPPPRLGHTCAACRRAPATTRRCSPRVCPTGMVFVPSVGGISHNPAEHTDDADLEAGANVLLHVMLRWPTGRGALTDA